MRTIFFDFGNVVAFFDPLRTGAALARHTDYPPAELCDLLYEGPFAWEYVTGNIPTDEYVRLGKHHGRLACTDADFLAAFNDIFTPNPDVCAVIPRLKPRYRLVLASNTNDAHFRHFSGQFADTLRHFDALCPSHHARSRKPHPEYYAYCQRFADAEPHECLFVDDLPENVEAAQRHGWKTICYRPGDRLEDKLRAAGVLL